MKHVPYTKQRSQYASTISVQFVLFHQSVLLFLTVGDDKGGHMVLHGEPAVVAQLGPQ